MTVKQDQDVLVGCIVELATVTQLVAQEMRHDEIINANLKRAVEHTERVLRRFHLVQRNVCVRTDEGQGNE